jgi:hypothetical protein
MLGSPCSPCCGCRAEYDSLVSKSCTLTLGGDVPAQDAAFTYGGWSSASWSITPIAYTNGIFSPPTVVSSSSSCPPSASNPIDETISTTLTGTAWKQGDTPIGQHALALDLSNTFFSGGAGRITFSKKTADYDIALSLAVGSSTNCVPIGGLSVYAYAYSRDTVARPSSLRRFDQSGTLSQSLIDSAALQTIFGHPAGGFYKYCAGIKFLRYAFTPAPYYVCTLPPGVARIDANFARYSADISNYSAAWDSVPSGVSFAGARKTTTYSYSGGGAVSSGGVSFTASLSMWSGAQRWATPGVVPNAPPTVRDVVPTKNFEFVVTDGAAASNYPLWGFSPAEKQLAVVPTASGVTSAVAVFS